MKSFSIILICIALIQVCVAPPAKIKEEKPEEEEPAKEEEKKPEDPSLELEYKRYLQEVVSALESDPDFRKKLEKADQADFYNGKVASELEFVNHNVRTKLDELKRTELQRLNELVKKAHEAENEVDPSVFHPPQHLDHTNPLSFEVADLHKLITKVTQDLQEADQQRREEFKQYEMEKEFEKEQKLKSMDEKHKEEYLQKLEEQKKKHAHHPHVHHPGSKAQLEEVWQKQDHMEQQEFNPKTFFYLHDLDGNGYWDEIEVKALFKKELDKLFQSGQVDGVDMRERYEEMERMREEFFKDVDSNKDHLISLEELLTYTKKKEFQQDEGWQSLDQQQMYTQKEYEEFEARRLKEIQKLIDQGVIAPHPYGAPQPQYQQYPQHYGHHPQQQGYQVHPQGYQAHPQGYEAQHVQAGYPQPPHGQHPAQGYHQPQGYHQQPPQGYHQPPGHHQPMEHHQPQGHHQSMEQHQQPLHDPQQHLQQPPHDPQQHHQQLHQAQAHHQEHHVNQQAASKEYQQQQQYGQNAQFQQKPNQPPPGAYQQPPQGAFQQPQAPAYQQQPQAGSYQQPQAGSYQQPPPGSYQQPPPGAYQQPPQYQQQPIKDVRSQETNYQGQSAPQPPSPVSNQQPSSSSTHSNQPKMDSSQQNAPPQPPAAQIKSP